MKLIEFHTRSAATQQMESVLISIGHLKATDFDPNFIDLEGGTLGVNDCLLTTGKKLDFFHSW